MDDPHPYIPVAAILLMGIAFGAGALMFGRLIGPKRDNPSKALAYESGMEPIGEAHVRIPVKFYMVGLMFLLFDIEAVYVLAWAVIFQGKDLFNAKGVAFDPEAIGFTLEAFQRFAFFEMLVFLMILVVGYVYAWRKGGLKWS